MRPIVVPVFLGLALGVMLACGDVTTSTPADSSDAGHDSSSAPTTPGSDASGPESEGADAAVLSDASDAAPAHDATATVAFPAPHPSMPTTRGSGGPVLPSPKLVPVFFAGDPYADALVEFQGKLVASAYWTSVTASYGVGAATASPAVRLTATAPVTITSAEIETWLTAQLVPDAGTPTLPPPAPGTVFLIYFPLETTVTMKYPFDPSPGPGLTSCVDFGGFHSELVLPDGTSVVYGIMPRCNGYLGNGGLDFVTAVASHEIVEAVTDPYVITAPAYGDVDFAGSGWSQVVGGAEIGDLCKLVPGAFVRPPEVGFLVQRMWSNERAGAGHQPCVPAASTPYFNAAPLLDGTEIYPGAYVKGLSVPPGSSRTIDLRLYSDGPTAEPWSVKVSELGGPQSATTGTLSFALDKDHGSNGDVLHLTISRAANPDGSAPQPAPMRITSTLGGEQNVWFGIIGN